MERNNRFSIPLFLYENSDKGWVELIPQLQKTLDAMENPYINGIEGFFILESSVLRRFSASTRRGIKQRSSSGP